MDLRIHIVITQADVETDEAFAKTEQVLGKIRELAEVATVVEVDDQADESGSEGPLPAGPAAYPGPIPWPGEQSPGWRGDDGREVQAPGDQEHPYATPADPF